MAKLTKKRISEVMIVVTVMVISTWTAIMASNDSPGDTISEAMRSWAGRWWVIPFAWAALFGHWFGPCVPAWMPIWSGWVLAGMGVLMFGLCAADTYRVTSWWVWWLMGIWGAALGALCWPLCRGG